MNAETSTTSQDLNVTCTPEVSAVAANEARSSFLVMSSIIAPQYRADKRAPVDMICVIDRSGSMSGDRLQMAKATVEFVVQHLQAEDRLGIVSYDDSVSTNLPLTAMTHDGKERATSAINSIAVGGSTNLCGGLVEGINQMRNRSDGKNEVASVLLFTDGQANVGYVSAEDIIKATVNADFAQAMNSQGAFGAFPSYGFQPMASRRAYPQQQQMLQQQQAVPHPSAYPPQQQILQQQQLPASAYYPPPQQAAPYPTAYNPPQPQQMQPIVPAAVQAQNPPDFSGVGQSAAEEDPKKAGKGVELPLPCTINTFGFGSDHDATLLKKIADHGQGMYYFIDSTKSISEAYADCLAGLLSVVGQDIKVTFEVPLGAASGVKINRVMTKFRSVEVEPGRVYELSLGDIQSEERRDILVDLSLPATGVVDTGVPVLKTTVSYTNVITGQREASASHTATIGRPAAPTGEARNYSVDKQLNRLLAAEAMEQSNEAARGGNLERAREILRLARGRIQESVSRDDDFCKSLVNDLQRCEGGLTSHSTYAAGGSKMLSNQMQAHYVQRSTNVGWGAQASYQSSARCQMQSAFNAKFS